MIEPNGDKIYFTSLYESNDGERPDVDEIRQTALEQSKLYFKRAELLKTSFSKHPMISGAWYCRAVLNVWGFVGNGRKYFAKRLKKSREILRGGAMGKYPK